MWKKVRDARNASTQCIKEHVKQIYVGSVCRKVVRVNSFYFVRIHGIHAYTEPPNTLPNQTNWGLDLWQD